MSRVFSYPAVNLKAFLCLLRNTSIHPEYLEGWGHDDTLPFVCFPISVAKLGYRDIPDIYVYNIVVPSLSQLNSSDNSIIHFFSFLLYFSFPLDSKS